MDANAMTISDDILSALIDGELEAAEAERVEALIRREPMLAQRVQRLRLAQALTQEAFAPFASAPLKLRAAAGAFDAWPRLAATAAIAIAAGAAGLVLGLALGGDGEERLFSLDAGVVASAEVAAALDQTASGDAARRAGFEVAPLYSFRDQEDRLCRAFRASVGESAIEAAACRQGDDWRLIALAPADAPVEGFSQAGGVSAAVIESAIGEVWKAEIGGEEERALIARRWIEE
jgi:hypothetical protein